MSWSPDSQHLVFVHQTSFVSGDIVAVDVSQPQPPHVIWSSENYFAYSPEWSPDGNHILYVTSMGQSAASDHQNLWLVKSNGTEQTQITRDMTQAGQPHWSPDGQWIVFTAAPSYEDTTPRPELWLVNPDGTELKRLTSTISTVEWVPAWSPDGTQIVFIRDRQTVWVISLADGSQTMIPVPAFDFAELIALP